MNAKELIEAARPLMLEKAKVVELSGDKYRELVRKAAAYDAGAQRWAVKCNGKLIDYPPCDDSEKDAMEQLAKLWTEEDDCPYTVVPVRIVEVKE